MMAPFRTIATSGLSFVIGAATFVYLNTALAPYFQPLLKHCSAPGVATAITRVRPIDATVCLLLTFFQDALNHPWGPAIWLILGNTFLVALALMAIESSRQQAKGPVAWYAAITGLAQLIGVSVAFPAIWLPGYLLTRSPAPPPTNQLVSPQKLDVAGSTGWRLNSAARVQAIGLGIWLATAAVLSMTAVTDPATRARVILLFQIVPPAVSLLWWPFSTQFLRREAAVGGSEAAIALYNRLAGGALVLHAIFLLEVFRKLPQLAQLPPTFWPSATESALGPIAASHFLVIDFVILFLALVIFVVAEDGVLEGLKLVALAPIISPGAALALYLGEKRERRILAGVAEKQHVL